MKIKKGFVVRSVGGENVGVPVGAMGKEFHGMIKLNESAKFLWDFFTADHTEEEAVAALLSEYDVDESVARADVAAFIGVIQSNGLSE